MNDNSSGHSSTRSAYIILIFMPLFFSTNILFGRFVVDEVEPWTLAFLRWFFTALILSFIAHKGIRAHRELLVREWKRIILMGFLGMWICGAVVYLALKYTTATNGTLIYTSSPVLIILIEMWFRGRKCSLREGLGILLALTGILTIISKGDATNLLALKFNPGDLLFVLTALSWAVYSVMLRAPVLGTVPTLSLFAALAAAGALTLLPFAVLEISLTGALPHTEKAWFSLSGIVVISSLLAFSSFQYGVKILGASIGGVFLYLLPVYGVFLAVTLLGEPFLTFHFWGIVCVGGGVILATAPTNLLTRQAR